MARESNNTNRPDEILSTIKTRLISRITDATINNVYVSTIPDELPPNPAEIMYEISPGSRLTFDEAIFTGAGQNSVNTTMYLSVTVHITQQKDEMGRDEQYLTHSTLGALLLVREIIMALAGHDLLDSSDNEQLSQLIHPVSAELPPRDDRETGFVTVVFKLIFDWDMAS